MKDNRLLTTGYNGAVSGADHCSEIGCLREEMGLKSGERYELCRAVHAEQNAVIQAAKRGIAVDGAVLYCTDEPCPICKGMLVNAGIRDIKFKIRED